MSETALQENTETNGNALMVKSPDLLAREYEITVREREFALQQRQAKVYADSSLVPQHYRGNIGNVLIAQNMAKRMNGDLLMIMQNLYVVHGNPGWSSQYLIATFNANGRFSAIKYEFSGEGDEYGCMAYCTELATGEKITGTKITLGMAKAEKWYEKTGSKWKTIADQMFRYRSAAFLIRTTAPEIAMGLLTKEELEDIHETPNGNGSSMAAQTRSKIDGLKDKLTPELPAPAEEPEQAEDDTIEGEIVNDTVEDQMAEAAEELKADNQPEPIDPKESKLEDLIASAKEKINQLTGGEARAVGNLLNGRTPGTMDMKQIKAFHKELDKLIDDQG